VSVSHLPLSCRGPIHDLSHFCPCSIGTFAESHTTSSNFNIGGEGTVFAAYGSVFRDNTANSDTAVLRISDKARGSMTDCLVTGNVALLATAGIRSNTGATLSILRTPFRDNRALTTAAGCFEVAGLSTLTIDDCKCVRVSERGVRLCMAVLTHGPLVVCSGHFGVLVRHAQWDAALRGWLRDHLTIANGGKRGGRERQSRSTQLKQFLPSDSRLGNLRHKYRTRRVCD
jgi:hypothetical protein